MRQFKKRIYQIIEVAEDNDLASKIYDWFMMAAIVISILPLMTHNTTTATSVVDKVTVVIFIVDYVLRWITADEKLHEGVASYLRYPFTGMAIVDLISILPSLTALNSGFKLFKILRLMRTFRVFRVFKAFRYSKNIQMIGRVFQKQKDSLLVVCWLAIGYILVSALIVFNVEPQTFPTFFDAIYWATISLTTVGYGDIYPVSTAGKVITMFSSVFGIAIVALPAGIITAGYMTELEDSKKE